MGIPLDLLITKDSNVYEMTCAVIKRAELLTLSGESEELALKGEKVVSTAIGQILTKKVEYEITD
ncbi:MAG: DNA-directed RNA polymerase subunit omega [Spirochaetes bacterium]|nr:MAG: DNA-directed RNA polymerase subunit omega [Spirochaetota bacterium]